MGQCTNNVVIPAPLVEPCLGKYTDDSCAVHPEALVELGIPVNSSVNTIIQTMYTAIISMQQRLTDLETP